MTLSIKDIFILLNLVNFTRIVEKLKNLNRRNSGTETEVSSSDIQLQNKQKHENISIPFSLNNTLDRFTIIWCQRL